MSCRGKRIHYHGRATMGKAVNQWAIKGERPLLAVQSVVGVNLQGEEDTLLCHAGGRGYIIMSYRRKRIHYYVMQGEEDTLLCHTGGRGYIVMSCRGERIHYYVMQGGEDTLLSTSGWRDQ